MSVAKALRNFKGFQAASYAYSCFNWSVRKMGGAIRPGHRGTLAGGERGGESVGLIIPVSQTSDCDRGGLLKPWVVEANSQMSLRFPSSAA